MLAFILIHVFGSYGTFRNIPYSTMLFTWLPALFFLSFFIFMCVDLSFLVLSFSYEKQYMEEVKLQSSEQIKDVAKEPQKLKKFLNQRHSNQISRVKLQPHQLENKNWMYFWVERVMKTQVQQYLLH